MPESHSPCLHRHVSGADTVCIVQNVLLLLHWNWAPSRLTLQHTLILPSRTANTSIDLFLPHSFKWYHCHIIFNVIFWLWNPTFKLLRGQIHISSLLPNSSVHMWYTQFALGELKNINKYLWKRYCWNFLTHHIKLLYMKKLVLEPKKYTQSWNLIWEAFKNILNKCFRFMKNYQSLAQS